MKEFPPTHYMTIYKTINMYCLNKSYGLLNKSHDLCVKKYMNMILLIATLCIRGILVQVSL